MTVPTKQFANDDDAAQYWLTWLRDGDDDVRIQAREQLAAIFERRGMLEEATELLISNVRDGVRNADIYRWLARLYRNQGQEVLAMQAAAEAAKYMPPNTPPPPVVVAPSVPIPTPLIVHPRVIQSGSGGCASGCLKVGITIACLAGFGVLCLIGLVMFTSSTPSPPTLTLTGAFTPVPATAGSGRSGKAEVTLGARPFSFGSQGQARELLTLMDQQPGRADYRISYETTEDAVTMGAEFSTEFLGRVHVYRDGRCTKESWRGYIMDRLKSAAAGGSLNDTPAGKSLVNFESGC